MKVTVQLHTILQRSTSKGTERELRATLPAGSTVADLLVALEVPSLDDNLLVVVNGRTGFLEQPLSEGDHVHIIPAISGGAAEPSPCA